MKTDPVDIDLIERFLKGQLSHEEAMDFETRLEEDHEFARKLRLRKTFPSLFKAEGQDEITMEIEETPEEPFPVNKVKRSGSRRGFWVIVVMLLIAAAGFLAVWFARSSRQQAGQARVTVKAEGKPSEKLKTGEQKQAVKLSAEGISAQANPAQVQGLAPVKAAETPAPAVRRPIELLLPADSEVVSRGQDVVFKWRQQTDSFTNFYLISEAGNKLAWWRGIKPGVREITIPAINFKTGKFFWYVGSKQYRHTLIIADI